MGSGAEAKYRTVRRLAVGGMGEIFLAREQGRLSRLVVLKKMLPHLARGVSGVDMFVDEARIVGHLAHPNICQILELGDEDGVPFIVLEYVRGESVAAIWDRAHQLEERIPLPVTLRILADTARGLHFAHEATDTDGRPLNIVHRDVTPQNVMVTFEGDVKLMDFGVARADNRLHRTDTGQIKGKLSYMSPEQLRGLPLDRRADVFALGVMLWELTLQRRLFRGADEVETLRKASECIVPRPGSVDRGYPPGLEAIVMRALAAKRDDRIATAGELATALGEQIAELGGVERDELGAIMQRLFRSEVAADEEERTAELVKSPPRTAPLAVVADAPRTSALDAADLIEATPEPVSLVRPAAPRSSRGGIAIALVALAAAGGAGLYVFSSPGEVATPPAPHVAPPAVAAAPPAASPDPPIHSEPPPASAPVDVPAPAVAHHRAPHRPTKAVATGSAGSAIPIVPAVTAPPAPALIAVSSDRNGVVLIDGQRYKSTPFQTAVPAGHHEVAIELPEGAGTLRAPAVVADGHKTKCIARDKQLVCDAPP